MRKYNKDDHDKIEQMLLKEDLVKEEMRFEKDNTYINDVGFFTYSIKHNYPFLQHFCVEREKRSVKNAIALYKDFKKQILSEGYNGFIFEVTSRKKYLSKIAQWLCKRQPYATINNSEYYLVGIGG